MRVLTNLRKFADDGRMALDGENGTMSFYELDRRSDAIACWLADNIGGRQPVALWGDKEHDMVSCIFGALKSGHPYVVIPSHFPSARAAGIMQDCMAPVIFRIGDTPLSLDGPQVIPSGSIDDWVDRYRGYAVPESTQVQPRDTCCLFYTSGSTGSPKGVLISRANIESMNEMIHLHSSPHLPKNGGRVLNFATYAASASMGNLFYFLGEAGCTLHAVSRNLAMDYRELFEYILRVDPHYQQSTPSFVALCLNDPRFCRSYLPSLKFMILGGEAFPHAIGRQILQRFPDLVLCNGYGATETTIGPLVCHVDRAQLDDMTRPVPIGLPAPGSLAWIAGEDSARLPEGRTGELVIVSDMVSQGYLNQPGLTRQVFFTTPDGRRGFKTGDLAYIHEGQVYFVGRQGNQVKVGGYRMELEEIEKHLRSVDLVLEGVVVPVDRAGQTVMLAAFVVLRDTPAGKLENTITIKKALSQNLPAYMIPQKIVVMEQLPRNTTGKVDRALLKEQSRLH